MTAPTAVPGLGLVLEHLDLVPGGLADDPRSDFGVAQFLATRDHRALGVDEQHRREGDLAVALNALNVDDVAFANLGLLAAAADDGVHDQHTLRPGNPLIIATPNRTPSRERGQRATGDGRRATGDGRRWHEARRATREPHPPCEVSPLTEQQAWQHQKSRRPRRAPPLGRRRSGTRG